MTKIVYYKRARFEIGGGKDRGGRLGGDRFLFARGKVDGFDYPLAVRLSYLK